MNADDLTIPQLRAALSRKEQQERDWKRRQSIANAERFTERTKVNVYSSDDYCGMSNGTFSFYYGYEETDENEEWCFVAKEHGVEVFRLPAPELWHDGSDNMLTHLVAGIGQWLQTRGGDDE
jgi:hypothetical protein